MVSPTAFRLPPLPHGRRRIRSALLALMLGALLLAPLVLAAPARAHDELIGSNPADGAVLAEPPARVELTFSGNPAAIGSVVRVSDADGGQWSEGEVAVLDQTASQDLSPGMPAGEYTVQWRVVSSDAHPIEGSFSFTLAAGAEGAATAGPGPAQTSAAPEPGTAQRPEAESPDAAVPGWVIASAVAAGVAALVVGAVLVRARLRTRSDD